MEQNTKSWQSWRSKGLGASDTPVILGLSPYKTPYQLWEIKTGRKKEQPASFQASKGITLEPMARLHYEEATGLKAIPMTFEHPDLEYMRCSLDGWVENKRIAVEIKCPSKAHHQMALNGEIPKIYQYQIQHQLFVSRAHLAHYYSFDGEDGVLIPVDPNEDMQNELISACSEFWELVVKDKPPELSERDWIVVRDKETVSLSEEYQKLSNDLLNVKENLERVRSKLVEKMNHERNIVGKLKISKSFTKGRINYAKVPEVQALDLEKYRQKGKDIWRITVAKD